MDRIPVSQKVEKILALAKAAEPASPLERSKPATKIDAPELTHELLDEVFALAEQYSREDPRFSWALSHTVAQLARLQAPGAFLEARALWMLGWAANEWAQPQLASLALDHARTLFQQLKYAGWVAACNWQMNALSWTKPNFSLAAQELEMALEQMQEAGLMELVPQCQLSLAYAKVLTARPEALDQAETLIDAAEQAFQQADAPLWVRRAWLQRAGLFRRRTRHQEATALLQEAISLFDRENLPIDAAKANYHLGLNYSIVGNQVELALQCFEQAVACFRATGLSLWEAACLGGLALIQTEQGRYAAADQSLTEARIILERYQISGMLADNLNDSARLALVAGDYPAAVQRFQRAVEINQDLGSALSGAIAKTNLGHVHAKLGNYQSALLHLEQAARTLEQLGNPGRLAECQLRLAQVWFQLGRYREAGLLLDELEESANRHGLESLRFEAALARAYCLLGERRFEETRELVSNALKQWGHSPAKPNPVFLKRAMGIALWQLKRGDALQILEEALAGFRELDMPIEESTSLALLGDYYADSGPDLAASLWQDAISKVRTGAPEAQIHILVRLAQSADDEGDTRGALTYYREASQLLRANTADFWQPTLFSFYLTQVSADLAQTLRFCHKHRFTEEAVLFMESMKAQTFVQQLKRGDHLVALSDHDRVNHLRKEIDKQRGELPSLNEGGDWLLKLARSQEGYENLDKLVGELEQLYSRLEREVAGKRDSFGSLTGFNLEAFRRQANRRLGQNWLALDYYIDDDEIFIAALSPDQCWFTAQKITPRLKMALGAASQVSPSSGGLTQNDLFVLSEHLLLANIQEQLTDEITLILSPHQALWSVPWAGLPLRQHGKHMVDLCVPVAVPSLESLSLLWKRPTSRKTRGTIKGAFVGAAQFGGRQDELPYVEEEFSYMEQLSNARVKTLLNQQATRASVAQLFMPDTGGNQHTQFDFLHIATHMNYDVRTNHLCNLQLSDGVLWSDEVGAFHNFPALVYFSACNGASSFVYEGGEQLGLPITCLVRGASVVVGSRFAVTDQAAFNLTKRFYHHLIQGKRTVAKALALAQQDLRDQGSQLTDWASFICMGIPDIGGSA